MRIINIQKILIIASFVMAIHSNTLKSMHYDYAKLVLINTVNIGVHIMTDSYYLNPSFSSLVSVKNPMSTYFVLGLAKTLYDIQILHYKSIILTNPSNNNNALTDKKGINLNVFYSGLIQCALLYGFFVSDLHWHNFFSRKSAAYFGAKSFFLVAPTIILIMLKNYAQKTTLDN